MSRVCATLMALLFLADAFFSRAAEPQRAHVDRYGDELPPGVLARLGSARFRDGNYASAAALSPDGKIWAAASNRETVRLWDTRTGKELRRITSDRIGVNVLVFSPDGKRLATGGYAGAIGVWDVDSGKEVRQIPVRTSRAASLTFSGDGSVLASGGDNFGRESAVHVWDVATGKQFGPFSVPQQQTTCVLLAHDGKRLLTRNHPARDRLARIDPASQHAGAAHLWDVVAGKELRQFKLEGGLGNVSAAAFSPAGKAIAVADGPTAIGLWDVDSGEHLRHFAGRSGVGAFLAFAPDGKTLAAVTPDAATHFWDVASGKRLAIYDGPSCHCRGIAFGSGGKVLGWGIDGQAFCLWDVKSGERLTAAEGHTSPIAAVMFLPDSKQLASVATDGKVYIWDRTTCREVRRIEVKEDERFGRALRRSSGVAFAPAGTHFAAALDYSGLKIIELPTGKELRTLQIRLRSYEANAIAFTPDGKRLITSGEHRGGVIVWDANNGQKLHEFAAAGENFVRGRCLAVSPDGKLLAESAETLGAGAQDAGSTRLWDLATGKEFRQLASGSAHALAFNGDGTLLATSGRGGVKLWDVQTSRELRQLADNAGQVTSPLVFSPDGRLLALGTFSRESPDGVIQLWEVASGSMRRELKGHAGAVTALAFTAEGRTLASGGADTTVLIWDLWRRGETAPARLSDPDLNALWSDLGSSRASDAHPAMLKLIASAGDSVPFLKKRLKAAEGPVPDAAAIAALVVKLDDDSFQVREQATRELGQLGKTAEQALKKALADKPSAEVRRRAEQLLDKLAQPGPALDTVRPLRAIEVLERIGTPPARELLQSLAQGKPDAVLTKQAKAAQERMK